MFHAHISPLLEPLLFAAAFIAVGWAIVSSRRGGPPHRKERADNLLHLLIAGAGIAAGPASRAVRHDARDRDHGTARTAA